MKRFNIDSGIVVGVGLIVCALGPRARAETCSIRSGATVPSVIELYTSEGCSSCPPADRWLSRLKSAPGIVALAFHVDYWDRLGWRDRFGSADYSARQAREARRNGASFSYTPQVVLNGEDYKAWHRSRAPQSPNRISTVDVVLERSTDGYSATVTPRTGAPSRFGAFWAVTEHGHFTAVRAGENKGERLEHDFVVREYRPVTAWNASEKVLRFEAKTDGGNANPRQVNLVVTDDNSGRPIQAVKLSCAPLAK